MPPYCPGSSLALGSPWRTPPHLFLLPDMDTQESGSALREIYKDYTSKYLSEALALRDICKDGTDKLKMVEGNPKNKVQISGVNEDISEDVTDELRKCKSSKLQYLRKRH